MLEDRIINRVAQSGIITFDLSELYEKGERVVFDIAPILYNGLLLREKDFRQFLKEHNWQNYQGKNVAITCSTDAIVPMWAYMLVATYLEGIANHFVFGTLQDLEVDLFRKNIAQLNLKEFEGKRVVIKGCSHISIPVYVYVEITRLLKPIVKSLMFGEPCSTVPIYKQK